MCTPGFIRFYISALFYPALRKLHAMSFSILYMPLYFETITCCTQMRKTFFWSYKICTIYIIHACFLCSSRHCDSWISLDVSHASLTLQYMDIINIFPFPSKNSPNELPRVECKKGISLSWWRYYYHYFHVIRYIRFIWMCCEYGGGETSKGKTKIFPISSDFIVIFLRKQVFGPSFLMRI